MTIGHIPPPVKSRTVIYAVRLDGFANPQFSASATIKRFSQVTSPAPAKGTLPHWTTLDIANPSCRCPASQRFVRLPRVVARCRCRRPSLTRKISLRSVVTDAQLSKRQLCKPRCKRTNPDPAESTPNRRSVFAQLWSPTWTNTHHSGPARTLFKNS